MKVALSFFIVIFLSALNLRAEVLTPVTDAVQNGDVELLQYYLENGYDPNERDPESNCTPLHSATGKAVDLLIAAGADVNAKCNEGSTPIFFPASIDAMNGGTVDNSKAFKLIKAGADINATNDTNNTILHGAVIASSAELVDLLVKNGADTSIKAYGETTPLVYACIWNSHDPQNRVLEALVKGGADIKEAFDRCLDEAASPFRSPNLYSKLIELGFDLEQPLSDGKTFFEKVVRSTTRFINMFPAVEDLLSLGVSTDKLTPMYAAILKNNLAEVKRLIDSGVSVDDRPDSEWPTPAYLAAGMGRQEIVVELIKRGAKLDPTGGEYYTVLRELVGSQSLEALTQIEILRPEQFNSEEALHVMVVAAATAENEETLKWVLSKMKTPVKLSLDGFGPKAVSLMCLAGIKHAPRDLDQVLAKYRPGLIEAYVKDCHGKFQSPSDRYNFERQLSKMTLDEVKLVLSALPANVTTPNSLFFSAFAQERLDLADYFLSLGADVNYYKKPDVLGIGGYTSLFNANTENELQYLLARGARITDLNKDGLNPIWYQSTKEGVEIFVKRGVSINQKSKTGATYLFQVLGLASETNRIMLGKQRFYRVLIALGADVNIRNSEGLTVLEAYLKENKNPDPLVVRDLKAAGATLN